MPDRIIRESICTSETLNSLSDFEERFWHRLIVNCDDFGRFFANPSILRGKLFPLADGKTKKDMTDALNKLASVGLVELYEVDGKPFLHVVKWSKYQRTRATKSKFPPPPQYDNKCCQVPSNVPVFVSECDMRESICEMRESDAMRARDTAVATVMSAYLDKINPSASQNSLDELRGYVEVMGSEVCLRAIDIALDAKKATWNYIRAILRDKQSRGVRCLADWDALEQSRDASKRTQCKSRNIFAEMLREEGGLHGQSGSPGRAFGAESGLPELLPGDG